MRCLALPNQRALRNQCAADTAADRRADLGVVEVKLGARHLGLARRYVGLRLAECRDRDLVLGLRCGLAADQLFDTLGLLLGLVVHRLSLGECGFCRLQFHFELDRVDAIEHIPGLDVGALRKGALQDNSCDAGAHLGNPRRRNATRKFPDVGSRRRLQRDHAHLRSDSSSSCGRRGGLRLVAGGKSHRHAGQGDPSCNGIRLSSHPILLPRVGAQQSPLHGAQNAPRKERSGRSLSDWDA